MYRVFVLALPALLAACNVAPKASADGLLKPGQWTADIKIDSIDAPGMPPEMVDAYKQRFEIHRSKCITPEDANTPDRLLFGRPDGCDYSRQTMADGRISATMNCDSADARQTIQLEGDYEPEQYKLHVNGMVEGRLEARTVSYVATLEAHRTGACTATSESPSLPNSP
jgi:hypothetical protein